MKRLEPTMTRMWCKKHFTNYDELGLVGLWQRMMNSKADSKLLSPKCQIEVKFESCQSIWFFTCFDAVLMTQLLLKILSAALLLFLSVSSGPRCHCSYQCLPRLNSNAAWSTQDQASPTDNLIILVSLPGAQTDRWGQSQSLLSCWVLSSPAEPGLPPPLPSQVTKLYAAAPS